MDTKKKPFGCRFCAGRFQLLEHRGAHVANDHAIRGASAERRREIAEVRGYDNPRFTLYDPTYPTDPEIHRRAQDLAMATLGRML